MVRFAISKAPNEALALTNCVIIHPEDHKSNEDCIILNDTYVFSVLRDKAVERGHLGTSGLHRTWARVSFNDQVSVHPYSPKTTLEKISVQVHFFIFPMLFNLIFQLLFIR